MLQKTRPCLWFVITRKLHIQQPINPLEYQTCMSILMESIKLRSITKIPQLHAQLILTGNVSPFHSRLLSAYAICCNMKEARQLFDKMPKPNTNILNWNDMIRGYTNGSPEKALEIYHSMEEIKNLKTNNFTYTFVIKACGAVGDVEQGRRAHRQAAENGFATDVYVGSSLVDFYGKCGCPDEARQVFDEMPHHDIITWNSMVAGYVQSHFYDAAIDLFSQMCKQGIVPTPVSIVNILPAFAYLCNIRQSETIHGILIRLGYEGAVAVGTALLDMYFKSGVTDHGLKVFERLSMRNEITWTAMIAGLVHNGCNSLALGYFREMQYNSMVPCTAAVASMLKTCGQLGDVMKGQSIHGYVVRRDMCKEDINIENSLVTMYAKCGRIETALEYFERMQERDLVSWNAIISGYSQNGFSYQCLKLLQKMQSDNVMPDVTTFKSILPSCAQMAALKQGKLVHAYMLRHDMMTEQVFSSGASVVNALIDMYAKCGKLDWADRIFEKHEKDIVSWNTMILAHGVHGNSANALGFFSRMREQGITPDHITFVSILIACAHAGLVEEGRVFFKSMSRDYNMSPEIDHYITMVDLLGRAGYLEEAQGLIESMPMKPDVSIWGALLGACKIHNNSELAEYIERTHLRADSDTIGHFVLLSNIYSSAGRWDDAKRVREYMKKKGLKKKPGQSWIEVRNDVHSFVGGDRSHAKTKEIYDMLEGLLGNIKDAGYKPDKTFVMHDVEEEEKENFLSKHSEKLAIAFGLLETTPETSLHIAKNLRACGDCHEAAKFISKLSNREIILRDLVRFHHFRNGACSCGDYW